MTHIASIEIGSGLTTLFISEKKKISPPLRVISEKISFGKDLADPANEGNISQKTAEVALKTLLKFKEAAARWPIEFIAIATEAFRSAKNGQQICDYLKNATGLPIKIISSQQESHLGFATASIVSGIDRSNLIAFDMGSGSIQISFLGNDEKLFSMSAPRGTVFGVTTFWNQVRKSAPGTVNPVSSSELTQLLEILEKRIGSDVPEASWIFPNEKKIAGIGYAALVAIGMRNCGLGLYNEAANTLEFTFHDLKELLDRLTSDHINIRETTFKKLCTDSNVWQEPAIPSIALLYTLMKKAHFTKLCCSLNKDLANNGLGMIHKHLQEKP